MEKLKINWKLKTHFILSQSGMSFESSCGWFLIYYSVKLRISIPYWL